MQTLFVLNRTELRGGLVKKEHISMQKPVYLGPITVLTGVLVFAPLVITLFFSFMETGESGRLVFSFTGKNYLEIFRGEYGKIFFRSLYFAFQTNVICLLIGYPVAYCIVQYGGRFKPLLIFLIIIPECTAQIIRIYAFKTITGTSGVINTILLKTGIVAAPIKIMYTPYAVMLGLVYNMLPYMILPLYAALEGLNPALIEAARDLGASTWRRFFRVIIPLTKGGILAGTILVFVPTLGDYLVPHLMGGSKVMMVGNLVAHKYTVVGDIPGGSAFGVVLTGILIILLYLIIKIGGKDALEKAL